MNKPLLRKVIAAIRKEPRRFTMGQWIDTADKIAPCDTAACIAGFAVILDYAANRPKIRWRSSALAFKYANVMEIAQLDLQLTDWQTKKLFYSEKWPKRFRIPFEKCEEEKDRRGAAKIAIARIDYFMRTGR